MKVELLWFALAYSILMVALLALTRNKEKKLMDDLEQRTFGIVMCWVLPVLCIIGVAFGALT